MKYLLSLLMLLSFLASAGSVRAVNDPPLFSCTAPVGTITSQYNSGIHGIAGSTATYEGSDVVYKIDENYVLQCFCPSTGSTGIQSNWWKVDTLSDTDRENFIRRGWIFIPDGSRWGLQASPYLVRNAEYSCAGVGGGGSSSSNGSSSSSSNDSGVGGGSNQEGQVLSATNVLAAAGTTSHILMFALAATLSGWATYRLSRE
jgi:hypothetical protein